MSTDAGDELGTCPDCGRVLIARGWSGVLCPDSDCGWERCW